jgi:hypothetical protein
MFDRHELLDWVPQDQARGQATAREVRDWQWQHRQLLGIRGELDDLLHAHRPNTSSVGSNEVHQLRYITAQRTTHLGSKRLPHRSIDIWIRKSVPLHPVDEIDSQIEMFGVVAGHYQANKQSRILLMVELYELTYLAHTALIVGRCAIGGQAALRSSITDWDREHLIATEQDIGYYSASGVVGLQALLNEFCEPKPKLHRAA